MNGSNDHHSWQDSDNDTAATTTAPKISSAIKSRRAVLPDEEQQQQPAGEVTAAPPSFNMIPSSSSSPARGFVSAVFKRSKAASASNGDYYHGTTDYPAENANDDSTASTINTSASLTSSSSPVMDVDTAKKLDAPRWRLSTVGWSCRRLSHRQLGIGAAAMNGLCGGTSLVPMHYAAQAGFQGARYYFSYAAGAMIVNLAVLVGKFLYRLFLLEQHRRQQQQNRHGLRTSRRTVVASSSNNNSNIITSSLAESMYQAMPSWHVKKLWLPGLLSGVLFSVGMFGSIVSVGFLGQGVGNSFVQCKILVSGLWGILYYKEIRGAKTITKWFASASLAVVGILLLSHEHQHLAHH
uniref:Uncharacterized protein n=1 Tax=Cyclophora tenuis TaxID=216820 RepID=A0A7S1CZ67_CYCTE|mmetsp:Transcript_12967/g.22034  ORF Transcript_12967/g.22034 Transcript_12967/m.22034 type:complete len:352 (+) Transcript_12967:2-1057(+)